MTKTSRRSRHNVERGLSKPRKWYRDVLANDFTSLPSRGVPKSIKLTTPLWDMVENIQMDPVVKGQNTRLGKSAVVSRGVQLSMSWLHEDLVEHNLNMNDLENAVAHVYGEERYTEPNPDVLPPWMVVAERELRIPDKGTVQLKLDQSSLHWLETLQRLLRSSRPTVARHLMALSLWWGWSAETWEMEPPGGRARHLERYCNSIYDEMWKRIIKLAEKGYL